MIELLTSASPGRHQNLASGLFSPFQRRMCVMARTEGMVLDISFMAAWWFHVKHD